MLGKAVMIIALAFLPASAARSAQGTPLWGEAMTGMTPAEVVALFPAAHRPSYPVELVTLDLATLSKKTTGEESLRACALSFAGAPVCASFYFDKGKLFGVILTSVSPPADVPTSGALADKFRAAVAARFAGPPSCETFKANIVHGPSSYCTWWAGNLRGQANYSFGDLSPINRKRASLTASFMIVERPAAAR
ncbi:MAG: hypothetical protein JWM65_3257 [Sphingomonas bacterium]|nr:hypothetical protein [Sphingomonas bacterium]